MELDEGKPSRENVKLKLQCLDQHIVEYTITDPVLGNSRF
jgi:hypothetical protein